MACESSERSQPADTHETAVAAAWARTYVTRLIGKALHVVCQQPLLPVDLAPGVSIQVAYRYACCMSNLFGPELPHKLRADSNASSRSSAGALIVCASVLAVSETTLVHYTRRPKQPCVRRDPKPPEASSSIRPEEQEEHGEKGAEGEEGKGQERQELHEEATAAVGPAALGAAEAAAEAAEAGAPPVDEKYWKRRYNYFAKFDEGIRMDLEAWFEVTPESVARHIADRMPYDVVVDGTCGVGGNAIQFALTSKHVIGIDIDAKRLSDAEHNARIYGVRERMEFVCDDFVHFARSYSGPRIDAVFLSPPWGGPAHLEADFFSLKDVEWCDIIELFAAAAAISTRVALYLPRHINLHEIVLLAAAHGYQAVEVEKIYFEYPTRHLKLVVVYFGPEAMLATARGWTATKRVGPTGVAKNSGPPDLQADAPSECPPALGQLLRLPPLAGPLIRAQYCRFHYVGKYVVRLAMMLERSQSSLATASRSSASVRRSQADSGAGSRQKLSRGPVASQEKVYTKKDIHRQIAQAFCEDLCSEVADRRPAAVFSWLLGEMPLEDLLRLVAQAAKAARVASSSRAEDEHQSFFALFCFIFEQQFPGLHRRLLELRTGESLGPDKD